MDRLRLAAVIFLALASAACSTDRGTSPSDVPRSIAACGTNAPFTELPVSASNIMGWVPLGALNPPGHTFPTDHQYIYIKDSSQPTPLYSPGNATVTRARRVRYSTGTTGEDYAIEFMPCGEILASFGHVRTIAAPLLAALGPFDQYCSSYSPNPGLTVSDCYTKTVEITIRAGEVIGTTAGLDLLLFDSRVPPIVYANAARWIANASRFDHFHVAPFSDYYAEPARLVVRGLLGSFDGRIRRVAEPLGGTIGTDIAGTAQGAWINPGQPTYPETPHLAIVPDNVDPTRVAVSIGMSLPGIAPGAYTFVPASSGAVNRHPSTILPGAAIQCWEIGYGGTDRRGIVLVRLVDGETLMMEGRSGAQRSCDAELPWSFSSAAVTYKR